MQNRTLPGAGASRQIARGLVLRLHGGDDLVTHPHFNALVGTQKLDGQHFALYRNAVLFDN
jgi:hypothetical protein